MSFTALSALESESLYHPPRPCRREGAKLSILLPNPQNHATALVTKQGSTMNSTTLLACELFGYATEFCKAAERLAQTKPFLSHPTFYLAVHSLELAIKAHLAGAGVSKKKLSSKALGHSLSQLLREAREREIIDSLGLDAHDQRNISLGSQHYQNKWFEYPVAFDSTFPIGTWLRWSKNVIAVFPDTERKRHARQLRSLKDQGL